MVYLEPMPQEASRLRFEIGGIAAVREDGGTAALVLSAGDISGADLFGHQKRLATGWLPEGAYSGISIGFRKAVLLGEEGESSLLVPEEPARLTHPFAVARGKASALFLSFNPAGAVSAGVQFTPRFSIRGPETVISNLAGYVSSPQTGTITVFDKKTMRVVDIFSVGREPRDLALDQKNGRIFVALAGDDAIAVVDVLKGRAVDLLRMNYQDRPAGLALTPDGRTLVCVNQGSHTVSIIAAHSLVETKRIPVDKGPFSAAVSPSGARAYVMNALSNTVSVIDLTQQQLAATIAVEGSPLKGAFSRSGDRLFVISPDSPNLSVIDTSSLTVIAKIFTGTGAGAVRVDHRTGVVLVGLRNGGFIDFIDPFSKMRIDTIDAGGSTVDMQIDTEEYSLLAVMPDEQKVLKANLISKQPAGTIELDGRAYAVAVMGGN